jgi:hypothetical protein
MKEIDEWKRLTNNITQTWIKEYFDIEDEEYLDYNWMGLDGVGEVFEFADYYISFNTVLSCYKNDITKEQFFSWYDYCLENTDIHTSLAKFILDPAEKAKKEKEYLEELKQRVIFAEEELNRALKEYGNK